MTEIVALSVEQIVDAFKTAGVSEKRLNRLQRTNIQTPLKGTFSELIFLSFKTDAGVELKYPALSVTDKDGKVVGNVAVGTILQGESIGKARKISQNNTNGFAGKWFHATKPISLIPGTSEAEQISNLIGRSYTAKQKPNTIIAKIAIDENNKPIFYETEDEAIAAVTNKDCYLFTLVD